MRSIVGTQIITAGSVTVLGQPAGSPHYAGESATCRRKRPFYNDLRIVDNVRYFARCTAWTPAPPTRPSTRRTR
jgi:ABC-2 type transport system ATP-binding protein